MPQMSPMNWVFLYLYFSLALYFTWVKIYFFFKETKHAENLVKHGDSKKFMLLI